MVQSASQSTAPAIPKNDPRIERVTAVMNSYGKSPDALIQVLHTVQELFGYLPKAVLELVSKELRLPASRVYGVATFYHFFSTKPVGKHNCVVCMGTACYVNGAGQVLSKIEKEFGIKPGETTPDGRLGVQVARCIVSCGLAPVVINDGESLGRVKPDEIVPKIRQKMGEKP
jgi:bidirectional [NiFe] hydrogenase diaphorase subunit